MTDPGRATSSRPNRRETGRGERGRKSVRSQSKLQLLLGALIFLAVAASIVMVFSDSVPLLRIGLVAALWAAVIGAIAMTKYRKDSENDAAKTRDLKLVYELQLEREIAARREYELVVETQVRRQVEEQVRIESTEELVGLREEMAALRASLEALFDGELPDERTAVRAESHRLQELAGAPGRLIAAQAADLPPIEDAAVAPDEDDEGFEPDYEGYRQAAQSVVPGVADANDEPHTAETQVMSAEEIVAQGFSVQSFSVQSYTTDGVTTESFSAEGYSAEGFAMPGLVEDEYADEPAESVAVEYAAGGPDDEAAALDAELAEAELAEALAAEAEEDSAVEETTADEAAADEAAEDLPAEDPDAEDLTAEDSSAEDLTAEDSSAEEPVEDGLVDNDVDAEESADEIPADEDADEEGDSDETESAEAESAEDVESEHSVRAGGRSVADLMARLQASGTMPEGGVGRRRRRADS